MKTLLTVNIFFIITIGIFSQPLNGSYTIGGQSPDFETLQEAANALKSHGISGPVFFNIRPGIYMKDNGATSTMILDSLVAGNSPANRITFQPDAATGGNVNNVILQVNFNINSNSNETQIIKVETDYTTISNLTFRDADSLDVPARWLIRVQAVSFWNATIEGLIVDGCKFNGTLYYPQGQQFGTDMGIYSTGNLITATITNNHFTNLMRAVQFNVDLTTPSGDAIDVQDNRFDHLYNGSSGSGTPLGGAIQIECAHPTIRRNFVENSTGAQAIIVSYPITGIIEANYVLGNFLSVLVVQSRSSIPDRTDSLSIINNVLLGSSAIFSATLDVRIRNTKILHNTIIHSNSPNSSICLSISGEQCTVLNNIIFSYGGFVAYDQNGANGLISDHNLFYSTCTNFVHSIGGVYYSSLENYQSATGLDINSKFKDVSFDFDSLGIHLDECEAQNSALDGIHLPEVPFDYFGTKRDTVKPFIGAVEGARLPFDMFAEPFRTSLTGFPLSISAGNFDNSSSEGIAVPDWDNRQVLLFHNNGAIRTFTHSETIFTDFRPTVVKFYDLDNDGKQDLIIGGDTSQASVEICWGDGSGGFSNPELVQTSGRVRSIKDGHRYLDFSTIMLTEDDGFLPGVSYLGFVYSDDSRNLCHDVMRNVDGLPDTIYSVMADFERTDLDNDLYFNVIALSIDFPSKVFVLHNLLGVSIPLANCYDSEFRNASITTEYEFGTSSYLGNNSNIVSGDFDNDGDIDYISTGANDNNLIFMKNQGNFFFSADSIFTSASRGLVKLDYENDGDLDLVTINDVLDSLGITVFLNDGSGNFEEKKNCYLPFASGHPNGIVASDFDGDGKTDIAMVSRTPFGGDSLFVLYNLGGLNQTTEVKTPEQINEVPDKFDLSQNYPNPFNPSTKINFNLPFESNVKIFVYNILGEKVTDLVNEQFSSGVHTVDFNANHLASGIYIYTIEAKTISGTTNFFNAKKMILLK